VHAIAFATVATPVGACRRGVARVATVAESDGDAVDDVTSRRVLRVVPWPPDTVVTPSHSK